MRTEIATACIKEYKGLHFKMHFFVVFVAMSCILVETLSRPSRLEQPNSSEEVEYGGYDAPDSDHSLGSEDDTRLDQGSKADQDDGAARGRRVLDYSGNKYLQRNPGNFPARASSLDNFSDLKPVYFKDSRDDTVEEPVISDKDYQALLKRNLANRNFENTDDDQPEQVQHLTNRDNNNNYKSSRIRDENTLRKRTIGTPSNAADLLFGSTGNNRDKPNEPDKSEYNNEAIDSSEQSRYFKKYYNTMQAENRRALDDRNYENLNVNNINRGRRQVEIEQKDTVNLSSATNNKEDIKEDEETAIKRHIKKLSSNDLEELIETLSDDKKTLLKKIMDNEGDNSYESINKREITTKAEAVEENNDENGQSDLSKVQGGSGDVNSDSQTAQNPDTTETTKQSESQTENNENLTSTKNNNTPESSDKAELVNRGDQTNQLKSDSGSDSFAMKTDNVGLDSSFSDISKIENKRETNEEELNTNGSSLDDSKILDPSNDPGYVLSPDEDLSQLFDEEYQLHSDNKNKREANIQEQSVISDSMKSLEESFPNSNSYDDSDPYAGSNMAPLIRVKRKNTNIEKRAAGVLSDTKVAFCPFRAENDDEDNDEGNEFDDDGFYDRTSNYAKNNVNNKPLDDDLKANDLNFPSGRSKSNIINSQINDDTMSSSKYSLNGYSHQNLANIGSDTDSVLSGVEGVDENLMFNGASRNRRTLEYNHAKEHSGDIATQPQDDSVKYNSVKSSANYGNAPNYQENDAFGPLPRNYEGELGRYKRIRRVKQPATSEDIAATNT